MKQRLVALLPARGGSKGIPRKNLQEFGSGNLLTHKILQAQLADIPEIYVSTEDVEIKSIAMDVGARVIDRPVEYATDTASTDVVVNHAYKYLNLQHQDVIVLLQVTSPLLKTSTIKECIEKLDSHNNLECVFTVHLSHPFIWKVDNGSSDIWGPKNHSRNHRPRRQDLGIEGWETGGCYAIRVRGLIEQEIRYPEPTSTIPVSLLESIDIDSVEDLALARKIYEMESDN